MKARPRSVENRVAAQLNAHFQQLGVSSVERIPVLGRTGPDLSLNELELVVDVKSRMEVPKTIFFPLIGVFAFDDFHAVRLQNFNLLWGSHACPPRLDFASRLIHNYLEHMQQWTDMHAQYGISCLILHRPEMPIGASVAVLTPTSRRRLIENAKRYTTNHPRE